MVSQDFIGDYVGWNHSADDSMPADRTRLRRQRAAEHPGETRARIHAAGLPDIAGHREEKFLEVGVERAMERLLDAEILVNRNARGASNSARDVANQSLGDARASTVVRNRNVVQRREQFIAVLRVIANVVVADQILLHQHAKNRREAESVGARTHAQMVIRHLSGFGATRIDHDERAVRICRDVAEDWTRALEAMRLPWILADEYRDLSLLVASAEARPEKHVIDPELAGLFLGQGVGTEYRSESAPR